MTNAKQRLIIGGAASCFIIIVILLTAHPLGRAVFAITLAAIVATAVWEYYQVARNKGFKPMTALGVATSVLFILATFVSLTNPQWQLLPSVILATGGFLLLLHYLIRGNNPLINIAITVFGVIYVAITLSTILKISYLFPISSSYDGRMWLLYLVALTKMNDVGAYFAGKTLGKTPLAPTLSPKKTVEGAIIGLVTGIFTSLLFYAFGHHLTLAQALWLGSAMGVFSLLGDLAESLLKRDAGAKHSSHLPGLGGVLDIVDSIIFTSPLLYFLLKSGVIG